MKKIVLFVCALPIELKAIKEVVKNLNLIDFKIDFLISWVWSYNTIYSIKDYLTKNQKPDFVINIWVCWTINKKVFNDFFQVYRIKNSSNNREILTPIYIKFLPLKSILSSEKIITNKIEMLEENFVDMESFWIDFICTKEKIPFVIIKKVFDEVWEKSKDVNVEEIKSDLENFNYKDLILQIWKWLEKNKKIINLNENVLKFYKDYFRFTFSELEKFKKSYNKLIAYNNDFKDFFEENKLLNKKEFLKKLDYLK